MTDEFAICNNCGSQNQLIDIKPSYLEEYNKLVELYLFCLKCKEVQLKSDTKHNIVEYGVD